jgi:hypothetical protein
MASVGIKDRRQDEKSSTRQEPARCGTRGSAKLTLAMHEAVDIVAIVHAPLLLPRIQAPPVHPRILPLSIIRVAICPCARSLPPATLMSKYTYAQTRCKCQRKSGQDLAARLAPDQVTLILWVLGFLCVAELRGQLVHEAALLGPLAEMPHACQSPAAWRTRATHKPPDKPVAVAGLLLKREGLHHHRPATGRVQAGCSALSPGPAPGLPLPLSEAKSILGGYSMIFRTEV